LSASSKVKFMFTDAERDTLSSQCNRGCTDVKAEGSDYWLKVFRLVAMMSKHYSSSIISQVEKMICMMNAATHHISVRDGATCRC
jgi:hypothetical protein